jgi:hypothetical protein
MAAERLRIADSTGWYAPRARQGSRRPAASFDATAVTARFAIPRDARALEHLPTFER